MGNVQAAKRETHGGDGQRVMSTQTPPVSPERNGSEDKWGGGKGKGGAIDANLTSADVSDGADSKTCTRNVGAN